ncbi:MAG: LysM peptidoglycan-binding domain-containing M23 family metallopeptidase [bacterium]|nr:LysM peptidoglycan-binding domain-containing M23 family metallopeptidase [bacterium]
MVDLQGTWRSRRCVRPKGLRVLLLGSIAVLLIFAPAGCGGRGPGGPGVIHHVEAGENLYRIGLRYGVSSKQIARANGIRDVTNLRIGQRLFIPGVRTRLRAGAGSAGQNSSSNARGAGNLDEARRRARKSARQQTSLQFLWPVRGRLSSRFGYRQGRPHDGIDIAARRGTPIFSAESGRVIHSGRLGSYGKVVIVKHSGRYRTVYAHASKLLVRKGEFVERGQKIAEVGSTGRSTGPHVHFEIRRSESPQNPLGFLP